MHTSGQSLVRIAVRSRCDRHRSDCGVCLLTSALVTPSRVVLVQDIFVSPPFSVALQTLIVVRFVLSFALCATSSFALSGCMSVHVVGGGQIVIGSNLIPQDPAFSSEAHLTVSMDTNLIFLST